MTDLEMAQKIARRLKFRFYFLLSPLMLAGVTLVLSEFYVMNGRLRILALMLLFMVLGVVNLWLCFTLCFATFNIQQLLKAGRVTEVIQRYGKAAQLTRLEAERNSLRNP